ncbi:YibE/F family protein [Halodesulfovibrio spirochaetisodalis]|uniref:Membrane protein n=1 Tax=Halodesulfovibrio spirochaetisodalis TaxID=1560234 RepID=A0A1B7XQ29_9BACT|nr:YibE/F family protein [Halodesulfovibrio spirochaetisodalis]OBQ57621.1 membrane protein [Halodesulfovibrio spirochaetisodalis]
MRTQSAKRDTILIAFFIILSVVLWNIPTPFDDRIDENATQSKGRILSVDNSQLQHHSLVTVGVQVLDVEILEGKHKGETFTVSNQLMGRLDIDKAFTAGDTALLVMTHKPDGSIDSVVPQDHYRIGLEVTLLCLFALLLLLFGGRTGAKALLSFIFTGLVLWKIFVPSLLLGIAPIWLALAVVAILTGTIIFLVAGLTRMGTVAFLGAMLGVTSSCILAVWATSAFKLHGAVMPFAETLLYAGYAHLNITEIYVAAIFVAASGAVMDLAMDVAASLQEVVDTHPEISRKEALLSGLRVGRAVVGTMTTTLLLAYSGGYVTLLMAFMAQGIPVINIFNMIYVAAEVVKTLIGSFGLVLVAPFTACIGSVLFTQKQKSAQPQKQLSTVLHQS